MLAVRWATGAPVWSGWLDASRSFWWLSTFSAATWLLLVFPDGRLPSRGWRVVGWLAVAVHIAVVVALVVTPLEITPNVVNTFSPRLEGAGPATAALVGAVMVLLAVAFAALVMRWRASEGVEELQLKWVVAGFGLTTGWAVGTTALSALLDLRTVSPWVGALAALPRSIAIAWAILRYRLYAIDRIISRTVAYVLLTGLLVGVYTVSVVTLRRYLAPLSNESDLAVAASTLAVAALFGPARRRIQAAVDRRFDRPRYDAERTAAAFARASAGRSRSGRHRHRPADHHQHDRSAPDGLAVAGAQSVQGTVVTRHESSSTEPRSWSIRPTCGPDRPTRCPRQVRAPGARGRCQQAGVRRPRLSW